jgi:uncharacterized protein (TIGR03437 family)
MNGTFLRASVRLAIVTACVSTAALAQLPSAASLKGAYNVRYLGEDTRNGAIMSFSGTITFDGAGKYTLSGAGNNSKTSDKKLAFSTSGSYSVFSNGVVVIDNAFDTSGTAAGPIYGGLGVGLVSGSATEGAYCDLFIAVPVATAGTNATLTGTYNVASLEFLGGSLTATRDTFFSMNADGAGNLGNVTVKGTAQSLGDAATVQTSNGATYTVTTNGTGTLNLPAPSGVAANNVLLSGNKVLYSAPDGSFFIAGGATTYDMVIGAKAAAGASFNGLYFSTYLQNYATGSQADAVYSVSGSTNAISSVNSLIAHERTNSEISYPYDYTYSDTFQFGANGVSANSNQALGAGGNIMIAAGSGGNYLLSVYPKSVPMSSTGSPSVFLNPQGIVNAANNVPFTAQVSPGEVVTLYGTGFTTQTLTTPGLPFPNTLGGAQVNITYLDANSKSVTVTAPVYYVSPTQISAVVPFTVPDDGTQLTFSVTSNGTDSNSVTVFSGPSSPGIFTIPSGGLGSGAVLHADFSLVSTSSPAKSGETIQVFLTGLGTVTGSTAAGAAGPANPLATTNLPVDIGVIGSDGNFYDGTVQFAGLAPGLGGLYQVNVTLPANLPTGTAILSIYVGDGSDYGDGWNEQASISITK